ncbi:hypothetical protein [Nocardioides aestuarii]|uniref:SGNH hydrolase-type esterase domain-containing protein n=1 Tax=Nocardioides aestuarii TaxID=252231 RepID=A0ABW4TRJ1_9ACTN
MYTTTYTDNSLEDLSFSADAHVAHHQQSACEAGGFFTTNADATARLVGSFSAGPPPVNPALYELDPAADWTALMSTFDTSMAVTFHIEDCDGNTTSVTHQEVEPAPVPIFLPGTQAELDAMPTGTVLEDSYSTGDLNEAPDGVYTRSVTYRAVKGVAQDPEFTWEVAPRTSARPDGAVAYTDGRWSTPLPDDHLLEVRLGGCGNGPNVHFVVDDITYATDCDPLLYLTEGPHTVTLVVESGPAAGHSTTRQIDVDHQLVVGLGDSFGSGESRGDGGFADPNCRRAGWSAQALAALALEDASDHSTVTFLHLACSGATVGKGLLGPYPNPPGGAPVPRSQVTQAALDTSGWDIDAALLSIGGNDIGFADVLKTCGRYKNCPLTNKRGLIGNLTVPVTLHREAQAKLHRLRRFYARVSTCLTGADTCLATDWTAAMPAANLAIGATDSAPSGSPAAVVLSEYPDLATRTGGRGMTSPDGYTYCKNALSGLSVPSGSLDGIQDEEFAWAREVLQRGRAGTTFTFRKDVPGPDRDVKLHVTSNGLNSVIGKGPQGWTAGVGAFKKFRGHGYCAKDADRWITQMQPDTVVREKTSPFHPNKAGYVAWGTILARHLRAAAPPTP